MRCVVFQVLLDEVRCKGNEKNIIHCHHRGWYRTNCNHYEDAGVKCHAPQLQGHEVYMFSSVLWKIETEELNFFLNDIYSMKTALSLRFLPLYVLIFTKETILEKSELNFFINLVGVQQL